MLRNAETALEEFVSFVGRALFFVMASATFHSCSFSGLLHDATPCGLSSDYLDQVEVLALRNCTRDMSRHCELYGLKADTDTFRFGLPEYLGTPLKLVHLTGQVISVGRTEMSPSIWQNYCPQYLRTALLYPACSTISKRVHLFKNRRLSAMLIFCKHNINAYDSKKDLYSPSPLRHPRTHTCHWYTDFKDLFMKTRPHDLLAHEPLNSLVMYAMENFPFTFV